MRMQPLQEPAPRRSQPCLRLAAEVCLQTRRTPPSGWCSVLSSGRYRTQQEEDPSQRHGVLRPNF